jgi:hypothetical protein
MGVLGGVLVGVAARGGVAVAVEPVVGVDAPPVQAASIGTSITASTATGAVLRQRAMHLAGSIVPLVALPYAILH